MIRVDSLGVLVTVVVKPFSNLKLGIFYFLFFFQDAPQPWTKLEPSDGEGF